MHVEPHASRRAKDLVCMRQLAKCGYCARDLCDAFDVDHINECRTDDRECNLVACCALCHAIKSRHVRLGRDWSAMQSAIEQTKQVARDHWNDGIEFESLSDLLKARVSRADVYDYCLSLRELPRGALDLEQYRYNPERSLNHRRLVERQSL
jgi:hypothetical protein